ncbi:MAG TPA: outer membrane protein assembly factor BamD [Phycisphaerae bacterium]|nr:outer membrane protein assembly factor BamD [Phycisphaerae bacterium]HOJ74759.1 outer membrane protein assembly factor BamD [Phycisphaerae bacterium]HOM52128.1 outer membrane protein assembly factor BamD [Phycisphaerae bacterium]HON65910.1 outer membrane protein assembly factor BamD [Phycisphaerae bacterium]HOQ85902.1 outer membrane protein assembly factor BamD [Phycisphaerae bacterium]
MSRKTVACIPVWVLVAAVFAPAAARAEEERPLPPVERAERLTFDEKTNTWIRTVPPAPGTPDGDLDRVRQLMAREDYKQALKAAKAWIKTYGTEQPRYAEALHLRATAYLQTGDYRAAHDDFQVLINEYGGSPYAADALESEFRIAEQYLAGKRRKAWKGLLLVKDREAGVKILDEIVANYPDTELAELAQRAKADYYYARGEFELAEDEYASFARDYPRSRFHPYALLQSARAALASFPGVQFDDAGLIEAEERFTQFMQTYPASAQEVDVPAILDEIAARRAEKTYEIGWFYERTHKKGAAVYYYRETIRRWPETAAAARAQGRLTGLGQPVETASADEPAALAAARPQ